MWAIFLMQWTHAIQFCCWVILRWVGSRCDTYRPTLWWSNSDK